MTDLLIGTGFSISARPGADPLADALAAERAGYDFVSASDHPVGTNPTYDLVTLLTWIAARTTTIGVATRVLGVPFRRPAMVAKAAESLQRLSGGRLILGLGGGYSDQEIAAVGAGSLTPGAKVAGLADAVTIMRQAWAGDTVTYHGTQHTVTDLTIAPAPSTPIPIWLGTFGPRALEVTGRLADGWIPSLGHVAPADIPAMLGRVRTAAVAAGRSPDAVRPIFNVPVRLDPHARTDDSTVAGSATDIVEQLRAFEALGFTGFNLMPAPDQATTVASEVLPFLRS